jgi:anhydro-N-acetylmuramic acid kinase
VQATLLELTVRAAAESLLRAAPAVRVLLCCGGGVFNAQLMSRLAKNLPGVAVGSTAEFGMHPMHVEAAAFAWFAWAHVHGIPGNSATSTGAKGTRCLGAFYPGSTLAER